jgi:hypothetical protein
MNDIFLKFISGVSQRRLQYQSGAKPPHPREAPFLEVVTEAEETVVGAQ